jgi:hypothetical protein
MIFPFSPMTTTQQTAQTKNHPPPGAAAAEARAGAMVPEQEGWRDIRPFGGAITAGAVHDEMLAEIRQHEANCALLAGWVARHRIALAGLNWRIGSFSRLEIVVRAYHDDECQSPARCHVGPAQIAARWPGAVWTRTKPFLNEHGQRNWVADIDGDGVKVCIERAEILMPVLLPAGSVVELPALPPPAERRSCRG